MAGHHGTSELGRSLDLPGVVHMYGMECGCVLCECPCINHVLLVNRHGVVTLHMHDMAVASATLHGMAVASATLHGMAVASVTLHGMAVASATLHGMAVTSATLQGMAVASATLQGMAVASATLHGMAVASVTSNHDGDQTYGAGTAPHGWSTMAPHTSTSVHSAFGAHPPTSSLAHALASAQPLGPIPQPQASPACLILTVLIDSLCTA